MDKQQDANTVRSATRLGISTSSGARPAPTSSTSASSTKRPGASPTIRASPRPPPAPPRSPIIDGDEGILLYRGYPIDELAENTHLSWRPPTCFSMASCRTPSRRRTSNTASRATRWCMSRWRASTRVFGATRIRWRSCAAWSARCRPSITTRPTSMIPTSAWSPRSA